MKNYHEIYEKNAEGKLVLVSKVELPTPSQEDLIADKEQQLLEMYNELQALKNNQ